MLIMKDQKTVSCINFVSYLSQIMEIKRNIFWIISIQVYIIAAIFEWNELNQFTDQRHLLLHAVSAISTFIIKKAGTWGDVSSGSPCPARTDDPSVNSRMLYHWAKEEYEKNIPGNDLFSRTVTSQVSLAQASLTSVFGMGTGVSLPQ